jgi:hypothetical protein
VNIICRVILTTIHRKKPFVTYFTLRYCIIPLDLTLCCRIPLKIAPRLARSSHVHGCQTVAGCRGLTRAAVIKPSATFFRLHIPSTSLKDDRYLTLPIQPTCLFILTTIKQLLVVFVESRAAPAYLGATVSSPRSCRDQRILTPLE